VEAPYDFEIKMVLGKVGEAAAAPEARFQVRESFRRSQTEKAD